MSPTQTHGPDPAAGARPALEHVNESQTCVDDAWEQAYLRFETPEEEIRKFVSRLEQLGARSWPKDAEIVELFCGRGNGLRALERLGFSRLEGVDLSARLISEYHGPARCLVGDCRALPFPDNSRDVLIVQGGLHHLPDLPGDLERTLADMRRVLRPGGRAVIVEPWLTPFLSFVHTMYGIRPIRRAWPKLDALATMNEHEAVTYNAWLAQPAMIRGLLDRHFEPETALTTWGKLRYVGRKPAVAGAAR